MDKKTMIRVKKEPLEDDPKVKRRAGGRFKALIDLENYDPEAMANYAKKIKFKNGDKVKIKGRITKDNVPVNQVKPTADKIIETKI